MFFMKLASPQQVRGGRKYKDRAGTYGVPSSHISMVSPLVLNRNLLSSTGDMRTPRHIVVFALSRILKLSSSKKYNFIRPLAD